MKIIDHASIHLHELPGLKHRTVAGPHQGTSKMEMWVQTIAPGGMTPWHRHDCEEIIVVLRGSGSCEVQGEAVRSYGPNSTIILGANEVHRLVNTGTEDLYLVAALAMAPVRVETPEGAHIPLPWDQNAL